MASGEAAPPVLRQISVRAVMDELLHHGPISRADLAKITGLSKQTMSEVIRALEDTGWVRIKGMTSGHVGRAAVMYEVNPDRGFVLGADLGATTSRVAVANVVGAIVGERDIEADPRGGRHAIAQLGALKDELIDASGVDRSRVLLAAVAAPGVIDPEAGTLSLAPNIADIGGFDFAGALQSAMGCDVVVENDINAAVVGESWKGCAVGFDEVAFISLGTGVGLGALVGGRLLRGAHGAAGEISYLPFGGDPEAADSLERGALECVLGARGLREAYGRAGGEDVPAATIFERAEAGDAAALAVVAEAGRTAARMVVAVNALLDPKKIVLGGNVGRQPLMVEGILRQLPVFTRRLPTVEAGTLGRRTTLIGAVAIALHQAHNLLFNPQVAVGPIKLPSAG